MLNILQEDQEDHSLTLISQHLSLYQPITNKGTVVTDTLDKMDYSECLQVSSGLPNKIRKYTHNVFTMHHINIDHSTITMYEKRFSF